MIDRTGNAQTLEDLQRGQLPPEPERKQPADQSWWDVDSSITSQSFGYPDNFDASNPFLLYFYIDPTVKKMLDVGLTLKFQKFRAYTIPNEHSHTIPAHTHQVTVSNHTHTVPAHTHGVTIANHTHDVQFDVVGGATETSTNKLLYAPSGSLTGFLGTGADGFVGNTTTAAGGGQSVTSASGGGATSSAGGGQTVTSASGGGATSSVAAGASYGVFEDTYPADVSVILDGTDITANLGGVFNPNASNDLFADMDLTPFITEGGLHVIQLTTTQRGRCLPLLWVKSIISR